MIEEKGGQQGPVLFHSNGDPQYFFLSNFFPSPFVVDNKAYPTNQHYFQSLKFHHTDPQLSLQILQASTAAKAKRLAAINKAKRIPTWSQIKEDVMYTGLYQKFRQNEELRARLLDTGDRELREHTERDVYWGDGGDGGNGKNRLGVLLMKMRAQLRREGKE